MQNKTFMQRTEDVKRAWHVVDAADRILGEVASEIAIKLMGKKKITYTPHTDDGDYVVVINAKQVVVTRNKAATKMYGWHSGYPSGLTQKNFAELIESDPAYVFAHAVSGMLPKNRLRDVRLARLKVYPTAEHPHQSQVK